MRSSAIEDTGGGLPWVAASGREGPGVVPIDGLLNTAYKLRLHFAELDPGVAPGQRVFDVLVNGRPVLRNLDIVARTGAPLRGLVETVTAEATDGSITVELRPAAGSERPPWISGIELVAEERR